MIKCCKLYGVALKYIGNSLKLNKCLVKTAILNDIYAAEYMHPRFQSDKEIMLMVVSQDGDMLDLASDNLRNDFEVVLAAVQNTKTALVHASKRVVTIFSNMATEM